MWVTYVTITFSAVPRLVYSVTRESVPWPPVRIIVDSETW